MKNDKNSILLVDPEFDPNTASDCNLLLKITPDSFSYAIIDRNSKQLKAVFDEQECEDIISSLTLALKQDVYLSLSFKDIKASVYTVNTVAIPDELYAEAELDVYAKFFTEEQSNTLYAQPEKKFGFTSIFNLHVFVEDMLNTYLTNAKRFEQNAPVLALAPVKSGNLLLLDFTVGSVNALLIKEEKMIFQNTYEISNSEEFNYYLVLMIQELQLDTKTTEILLSGIIHENDGSYSCISSYFNTISFHLPPAADIDYAILEDMPAHYYSSLLALDLCV